MPFPPMKAPAGLHMRRPAGKPLPAAGGTEGVLMYGPFGDCAFLLNLLDGTVPGDEFWIESITGMISAEEIRAGVASGQISKVN